MSRRMAGDVTNEQLDGADTHLRTIDQARLDAWERRDGEAPRLLRFGHTFDEFDLVRVAEERQVDVPLHVGGGRDVIEVTMGAQELRQSTTGGFDRCNELLGLGARIEERGFAGFGIGDDVRVGLKRADGVT